MRVVVIGVASQQTSLPVGSFPLEYEPQRSLTGQIRHTVGGVGFNVARVLSVLGDMVALASPLGEDYPAAMVDAEAYRYNISTHLCRRELLRTPRTVVLYDNAGRRMVNSDLTDASDFPFDPADLLPDVKRAKVVVLANMTLTQPILEPIRQAAKRLAVDFHDVVDPLSDKHRAFLSADFINMSNEHVRGHETELLLRLREESDAKVLSMTLGPDGALILTREMERPVHVPTPDVKAVNTVGAGETYWAVFLHHHLADKMDAVQAAERGCQAAARQVASRPLVSGTDVNGLRAMLGLRPESSSIPAEIGWKPYES